MIESLHERVTDYASRTLNRSLMDRSDMSRFRYYAVRSGNSLGGQREEDVDNQDEI